MLEEFFLPVEAAHALLQGTGSPTALDVKCSTAYNAGLPVIVVGEQ